MKSVTMSNNLEERCLTYAKDVRAFVKRLPKTISNTEDGKQLIRSSGSIGANYIEANEALGSKDFLFRLRIARKEAKESMFWLSLVDIVSEKSLEKEKSLLLQEVREIRSILSSIISKFK